MFTYLDGHICKQQTPWEFHEFYMTSSETHEQCFRASAVVEKTIVDHNGIKHKSQDTYVFDITDPPKVFCFIIYSSFKKNLKLAPHSPEKKLNTELNFISKLKQKLTIILNFFWGLYN